MSRESEDLLKLLVSIDTTNPPGKENIIIEKILNYLSKYNNIIKIADHGKDRSSLILTIEGECQKKCLCFMGHLDTVPIGNRKEWFYPPFYGSIQGNMMYGRGTVDMKGGLTAMILLYCHYKESEEKPPISLKFVFTADEEVGGIGASYLYEHEYFSDTEGIIICEPSNLRLGICEKGTIWLKLKIQGKSCHASMPTEGINALEIGMCLIRELKQTIENLGKNHPLLGNNTFSVTMARSGIKINIIPSEAEFFIDIRTVPNSINGNRGVLDCLAENLNLWKLQYDEAKFSIEIMGNRETIECSRKSKFIKKIVESYKKSGDIPQYTGIQFFTDASLIIPYMQIPFVILGPGDPKKCHIVDECIEISQIDDMIKKYIAIINGFS